MKAQKVNTALSKRAQIDKANTTTMVAAGVAAFLVVFSLVAAKSLIGQALYQNRVIGEKRKTLNQLKEDIAARDNLVKSYEAFVGTSQNVIGGNPLGSGDRDGDNGKIILDALPSKYDFPALTTSLEKLSNSQGLKIMSLTGIDDEAAQSAQQESSSPAPIPMQFELSVEGSYPQLQALIETFDKSIRPMQIQKLTITGNEGSVDAVVAAQTFYQPEKVLELKTKVVK
jgi:hypothetical protein